MGSTARLSFPDLYDCEMMLKDSRLPVRSRRAGHFPPPYRESRNSNKKPTKKETAIGRLLSQIPKSTATSEPSKSEARIINNVAKKQVPLHIRSQSLKTIITADNLKKAKEARNARLCPPNATTYQDTPEPHKPKQNTTVHMPTVPVFCKDIPKFFRTDSANMSQLANVDWYETDRQLKTKPKPKPESRYAQKTLNEGQPSFSQQRIQQVDNKIKRERTMADRVKLLNKPTVTVKKPWLPSSGLVDTSNMPVSPPNHRFNNRLKKTQSGVEGVQSYRVEPFLPETKTTLEEVAELSPPEHKVVHWLNSRRCDSSADSHALEDAYMYAQLCVNKESNLAPNINVSFEGDESMTPIAPSDSSINNVTNDNRGYIESNTNIAAADLYPKKFYVNKGVKLKSIVQSQAFVRKPNLGNYFQASAPRRNPPRGKQTAMADSSISAREYCKIKHDILSDVKNTLPPLGDNGDWNYKDDVDTHQKCTMPIYCDDYQIQEQCVYQQSVNEGFNVLGQPTYMSLDGCLPSVQGQQGQCPQGPLLPGQSHDTTSYQFEPTSYTQCVVSNEKPHEQTQHKFTHDNDFTQNGDEPDVRKVDHSFAPLHSLQSAETEIMLGPYGSVTSLASTEIEMSDLTLTSEDNNSSSFEDEDSEEEYPDNGSCHSYSSHVSIPESLIADGNSCRTQSTCHSDRAYYTDVRTSSNVPLASLSCVVSQIGSIEGSLSKSEEHSEILTAEHFDIRNAEHSDIRTFENSDFRTNEQSQTQEMRSSITNKQENVGISPTHSHVEFDTADSLSSFDHRLVTAPVNSPALPHTEQQLCEGVVQYFVNRPEEPAKDPTHKESETIEYVDIPSNPDGRFNSISLPKSFDKRKTAIKPQSFELMVNALEDAANPVVHKYNPPGQQRRRKHRTVTKNVFRNATNDYFRDREESPMFDVSKSQIDGIGDNLETMASSKETCGLVANQEIPMEGSCPFSQHNPISVYRAVVEPSQNICPANEIFLAQTPLLGKTENDYKHLTMPTIEEESEDHQFSLSEERTPEELVSMQQIHEGENNMEKEINMTAHSDVHQTVIDEVESFPELHLTIDSKEAEEMKEMYPTPWVINDDVSIEDEDEDEDEESCITNDELDQAIRPNTPYGIRSQMRDSMPKRKKCVPVQHLEPFSERTSNTVNNTKNTKNKIQPGGFQGSKRPPSRLIKLHTGTTQGVWHPAQSTQHLDVTLAHAHTVSSARQAKVHVPGYAYAVDEVFQGEP